MGVDHGGFYVFVSEEFLYGTNIVSILQEMGGERMAKGVGCYAFVYVGKFCGCTNGFLQDGFMDVMPVRVSCFGVGKECGGRKDELPNPFFVGGWIFFIEGEGHFDRAKSGGEVFLVDGAYPFEVFAHGCDDSIGEHGDPVVAAFSVVDKDAVVFKIYVFDAQAKTFHEAESAAVHDLCHEFVLAGHA